MCKFSVNYHYTYQQYIAPYVHPMKCLQSGDVMLYKYLYPYIYYEIFIGYYVYL